MFTVAFALILVLSLAAVAVVMDQRGTTHRIPYWIPLNKRQRIHNRRVAHKAEAGRLDALAKRAGELAEEYAAEGAYFDNIRASDLRIEARFYRVRAATERCKAEECRRELMQCEYKELVGK